MSGRLAYLAFWFPPSRASGVYRAVETVRAFRERGWEVTVFTVDVEYLTDMVGSTDETLLDLVPSGVDVVRVPLPRPAGTIPDVRAVGRLRATFPSVVEKAASTRRRFASLLRRRQGADAFDDPYVAWIDPLIAAISEANGTSSGPFDVLLATGNPFSSFQAARLAAASLDRPFIVDYRDPWTIDVFDGTRAGVGRRAEAVEAAIVRDAAAVIHVNEPIADAYRRLYPGAPEKHHVVVNGFDRESLRPLSERPADRPIRFGTLGTINAKWPLEEVIDGFEQARDQLPAGSEFHLAGHLGYFDRSAAEIEDEFPDPSSGFRYVGSVPKRDVGDFYESLDVVVVLAPGGPMVTSGKIFEAAAQSIPIVVVQEEGGGARAIVAGRDAAFTAVPSPAAVADALVAAAAAASAQTLDEQRTIRADMDRYERSRALELLVKLSEACRVG